jgi:hypothetical protein
MRICATFGEHGEDALWKSHGLLPRRRAKPEFTLP